MPAGIPVATVAIGNARNAGLLAVQILALSDEGLSQQLEEFRKKMAATSRKKNQSLYLKLESDVKTN
jgi:5-(carboxyamino)imidazole ribonucleotide mutase